MGGGLLSLWIDGRVGVCVWGGGGEVDGWGRMCVVRGGGVREKQS